MLMKNKSGFKNKANARERGVVLFVALIALVVMSLAAVALIRSVDTTTLIAGNLAFKQNATSSGDSGMEAAVTWLKTTSGAQGTKDPWTDTTYAFNLDDDTHGYYSSIATPTDLSDKTMWESKGQPATGHDYDSSGYNNKTGNTVLYIIQRMCRTPNQLLSVSNCLMSDSSGKTGSARGKLSHEAGLGSGSTNGSPIYRVTARVTGPKNTVSYIQAYTY